MNGLHDTRFRHIETHRIAGSLGAEIEGVDLSRGRFAWRTGSLALWDNRRTQHFAINDYPAGTRLMHRITIRGDAPY